MKGGKTKKPYLSLRIFFLPPFLPGGQNQIKLGEILQLSN